MATPEEMDEMAEEAEQVLREMNPQAVRAVAAWWSTYFAGAGHKRLGRVLNKLHKEGLVKALEEKHGS